MKGEGNMKISKKISVITLAALFSLLFAMTAFGATGKVTGLKQEKASTNTVSIAWDNYLGTNVKYIIETSYDNQTFTRTDSSYSASDLIYVKALKPVYVRVKAVSTTSENTVYAISDSIQVASVPADVKDLRQTTATTSSITISWTASEGATSYEIVRFVNNNEYVVGSTTSTTYTVDGFNNKLKNDTYVGVRPVRTVNGFSAKTTGFYNTEYLSPYKINLVPEKVQGLAITNYYNSLKEVTFGFTQPEYHDGYVYELYTYKKKKVSSGNLSSISYNTLKNIKNQFYKLRVKAYVTIDNKNYYGAWSDYTVFALQPKVGLKKSGKKLKITWKKVSGAKNYTVYMSTSKTGGYKKLTTTKKRAYTAKKFKKKKLNKKKTYYVYVVANRKEGKKTYKSKAVNCYYLY